MNWDPKIYRTEDCEDERKENELKYYVADIEGLQIFLHEAIWVLHHKKCIPDDKLVCHIDGNPNNNFIENLDLIDENKDVGDLHKSKNKIFHKSTFNEIFIKKHFSDIALALELDLA